VTVLVDPPAWPAHGTLWSHLVSDSSLHELRAFARAVGLPDRGFDLDHYDAPADRHADLVAAGAVPLDGRTLARRLGASGLRVPGHERAGAKAAVLRRRWAALWPDGVASGEVIAVGDALVERWSEPHRVYHGRLHLAAALDALDLLDPPGATDRSALVVRLALWFHDAVHDGEAGRDEERSAALAGELLAPLAGGPLSADDVAEVQRLVLVTADHAPADDDALGGLVSDADLAVLGAAPAVYRRYVHQVRAEYGHVPDDAFRTGRAAVLRQLLGLPRLYGTPAGRARWEERARGNLAAELASLG
jgi:predicted metal-dependent HD superfamily phosphohydrolase